MKQQTSIMSAAVLIALMSVVSAFLGIVNKRILVSVFAGESRPLLDAFFAAFRIPDFLFQLLVVGVLSATFIPVYTRLVRSDAEKAVQFVQTLMTLVGLAYIGVAVVVGIFATPIMLAMTGPAFSSEQVASAVGMMRVMLIAQFFFLLSNFLSGILQSHKSFILPALSPIMYNVGIIVGAVFLSPALGIYGPCFGVFIGAAAHLFIQLPLAIKYGFYYSPRFDLSAKEVKEVLRLMIPRGATQSTNAVEDFAAMYIATSFGNTLLALVTYASALVAAPIRFFGVSIAQAALPFLSLEAKEGDLQGFTALLIKTLHQIAFFMFPAGALMLVLRIPFVRLAFGAKDFPWSDTVLLGRMVALYSVAIAAQAMIHVVLRAFYALKETKTPFFIAFFSMGINVIVMWLGAQVFGWGVLSVMIGSSLTAIVELLLLLLFLFEKVGYFSSHEFFLPQLKMLLATALMGVSLYIPLKVLDKLVFDTTRTIGLIVLTGIVSVIGLVVYLAFCKLLKVEQLSIVASIRGRLDGLQRKLSPTTEVLNVVDETA